MSEDTHILGIFAGMTFVFGFFLGYVIADTNERILLTECAMTHNVYQCEIIAVPTKAE